MLPQAHTSQEIGCHTDRVEGEEFWILLHPREDTGIKLHNWCCDKFTNAMRDSKTHLRFFWPYTDEDEADDIQVKLNEIRESVLDELIEDRKFQNSLRKYVDRPRLLPIKHSKSLKFFVLYRGDKL